jgi:radical SAM protein with 4Fe4S-binding SPASM domain
MDQPLGVKLNYRKAIHSAVRKDGKSSCSPILLTVEPTNACNLGCPICETGAGVLGRKIKNMPLDEFKYILNQFDRNLQQLFFYYMGEPFLNRDAYSMIRFAADRGIWITTCTNGDFLDPEALVASGIAEVNFQIAGMTQDIHSIYRINGNLEKTLQNMERVLQRKRHEKKLAPVVVAGFILMKHNQHQVGDFIQYCKQVGVDKYHIIGTTARTVEQYLKYAPDAVEHRIFDDSQLTQGNLVPKIRPNNYCGWIYSTATINVAGDLVPCCRDPQGRYVIGNIFQENISSLWNNEKYQTIRKTVAQHSNSFDLCRICSGEAIPPLMRR